VFLINVPVGIASLALTWVFVSDSEQTKADRRALLAKGLRIDYVGFALVIIGFGTLQIILDRFAPDDGFGSSFVSWLTVTSAVSLTSLVFWELWHPQPLINLRLLKSRAFSVSCVVLFLFGFIIISSTQLTPQLTQTLLGYDATTAGMTLGMGGLFTIFIMPIAGIITGKLAQPKWLVFVALLGIAGATHYASTLNLNMAFSDVSRARVLLVVWLPFIFIPLSAVQFNGVPADKNNDASAILSLMRNLGGSVGISVATTELAWRGQFHHARLADHVTVTGPALADIASRVVTQASILSYLDVFTILSVVALCASPLALLLPKVPKNATVGAH
jgi:DHA2 family multidrug resistance protein